MVGNGSREFMIVFASGDPAKHWQTRTIGGREAYHQVMANIYLYTTELEGAQTYWFSIKNQTDPFGNPTDVIPRAYLGTPGPTLMGTTTVGSQTLTLSSANAQVAHGQSVPPEVVQEGLHSIHALAPHYPPGNFGASYGRW